MSKSKHPRSFSEMTTDQLLAALERMEVAMIPDRTSAIRALNRLARLYDRQADMVEVQAIVGVRLASDLQGALDALELLIAAVEPVLRSPMIHGELSGDETHAWKAFEAARAFMATRATKPGDVAGGACDARPAEAKA